MRVLCLSINDFWLAWARSHERAPSDRPVILTVGGRVRACSSEASLAGVQPGQTERLALVRCPQACIQEMEEARPRLAWRQLLAALGRFSPLIESAREGLACFPSAGLERHYRTELQLGLAVGQTAKECLGLAGGIGIADGRFVAEAAASQACPGQVLVVPTGAERYFLQDLPVTLLPLDAESHRQLRLLGIRTLEQYSELPYDAVQSRLGRPGCESWHRARGTDNRPLLRHQEERQLWATTSLDDPVRDQSLLARAVERLLRPLCDSLQREGLACQELLLMTEMEKGPAVTDRHVLQEPTADPGRLQAAIMALLARMSAAVQSLTVTLTRLTRLEAGHQLDLFMERQLAADLDATLAALAVRYGADCFQRARAISPEALLPEQRFTYERFQMMP